MASLDREGKCPKTADGADETYWLYCDLDEGHDGMCHDAVHGDFDGEEPA